MWISNKDSRTMKVISQTPLWLGGHHEPLHLKGGRASRETYSVHGCARKSCFTKTQAAKFSRNWRGGQMTAVLKCSLSQTGLFKSFVRVSADTCSTSCLCEVSYRWTLSTSCSRGMLALTNCTNEKAPVAKSRGKFEQQPKDCVQMNHIYNGGPRWQPLTAAYGAWSNFCQLMTQDTLEQDSRRCSAWHRLQKICVLHTIIWSDQVREMPV